MSWDVLLLRLPDTVTSVQEIPDDYASPSLGRQQDVLSAVKRAIPQVDLSDPTWGDLVGPDWSIELNIGSEDPVDSIMLHIRGSGDDALAPVFSLTAALECKALDCSRGDLLTPQDASVWHTFQEFRDRVIDPSH